MSSNPDACGELDPQRCPSCIALPWLCTSSHIRSGPCAAQLPAVRLQWSHRGSCCERSLCTYIDGDRIVPNKVRVHNWDTPQPVRVLIIISNKIYPCLYLDNWEAVYFRSSRVCHVLGRSRSFCKPFVPLCKFDPAILHFASHLNRPSSKPCTAKLFHNDHYKTLPHFTRDIINPRSRPHKITRILPSITHTVPHVHHQPCHHNPHRSPCSRSSLTHTVPHVHGQPCHH
jgi:hypothetical protein